jgi:transcriptional regulator with XRE-family HTH domain
MENVIRSGSLHLRAWREYRNLTLERIANRLDVKHSTVLRWEKGNVRLEPSQVAALAAIYECTSEELAFRPEDRAKGQLMHRLLETFRSLDAKDAADVVDIAERMPSARK